MLPSINTLRTKELKLNGKIITLKPWSNLQLTNFDSLNDENDYKYNQIQKYLINPNAECKFNLTILEEKIVLIELYKLSKSNLLDVTFTCKKCGNPSEYTINLEKSVEYKPLDSRTIKTKDCIFNLRQNSTYRMDLNKPLVDETLKYLASFIESFDYKDKVYEVPDIEEMSTWLNNELDSDNFEELIAKFDKIQNKVLFNVEATCEHCLEKQKLNFTGIEDFLV